MSSRELTRPTSSSLLYERRGKNLGLSNFPSRLRNPEAARLERDRILEKAKGGREREKEEEEAGGGGEEGLPMPSYQQGKSWRHTSSSPPLSRKRFLRLRSRHWLRPRGFGALLRLAWSYVWEFVPLCLYFVCMSLYVLSWTRLGFFTCRNRCGL